MKPAFDTRALLAGAVLGGGLVILAYARWVERLWIEVKHMQVRVPSAGIPLAGLRVLHLSDLHFMGHGLIERLKIERALDILADEPYDLLLITGDLIHDDDGLPATLDLIERLPEARLGAFACLGNHDYASYSWLGPARMAWRQAQPGQRLRSVAERTVEMCLRVIRNDRLYLGHQHNDVAALRQELAARGVILLENANIHLQQEGVDLWLAAVDDLMEGQPDVEATLAGMPANDSLRILLAHNPDHLLDPSLQQFDLAFSGHVHGGQIRLPLLGSPHTQGTHLPRRRPNGWFRYGDTQAYVSRGLGEGIRLRFNCRPEIALVHVLPAVRGEGVRGEGVRG